MSVDSLVIKTGFEAVNVTAADVSLYTSIVAGSTAYWRNNQVAIESATAQSLADAQTAACNTLINNFNHFIEYCPDGGIRYDINMKLEAIIFGLESGITAGPLPTFFIWMKAVRAAYYTAKAQIMACTTVAEVDAIDTSVAWFESRYGISGTVAADPNVTAAQLTAS